jgi:phosphoenolpyruvate carboxylase
VPIGVPHRAEDTLTLRHEHKCVQAAIGNLRNAYEELLHGFFSVAAQKFGDAAFKLRPKLTTVASWVGYDLDGRNDITWTFSIQVRLLEKRAALADIRERFVVLKHKLENGEAAQRIARQIVGKLDLAIAAVDEQIKALDGFANGHEALAKAANVITKTDGYNLLTVEPLLTLFDNLIEAVEAPQMKRAVAALAGLVDATGLGTAHIHLRINALQLNNAFRAYVHEPWTRDLTESQALARIVEMIKNCPRESVNFATLDLETATAIRQFALISQIHKHVDKETPIRFLIAECESPATVLIAVFFAKLFGVDDITDISPLFETPSGLENGSRIMERLVEEETYRDYVRGRKRISIQTGFSDAGRFIGQIPATLAIERYYHGLAALMDRAKLGDVEILIFSTHGESMGRGAHPGNLHTRLHYLMTDEARRRFADAKIPVKHETSFQGGDGYMYFGNRALTTRALATVVIDGEIPEPESDPFYSEHNFSLDFFLRLRAFQQDLFAHDGYRAVLGAFGPNLLFKTGSRPVKRQGEHASDRGNPARMRAIPNNAILQQFGYIANVVAGLGTAVGSDRDRFFKLAKSSKRLRSLLDMIAYAKRISSLNAAGANAQVFNAGLWASRASWGREQALEAAFRTLATHLLPDERQEAINELVHLLRLDAIDLHAILVDQNIEDGIVPDENRLELDLLQALRLALIMRIYILAAQLPRFTPQDGLSHTQVLEMALSLEIPEVLNILRAAFPHGAKKSDEESAPLFDEQATYRPRGIDDYARLETEILTPMESSYEAIREIGTGISHHFGAFG